MRERYASFAGESREIAGGKTSGVCVNDSFFPFPALGEAMNLDAFDLRALGSWVLG